MQLKKAIFFQNSYLFVSFNNNSWRRIPCFLFRERFYGHSCFNGKKYHSFQKLSKRDKKNKKFLRKYLKDYPSKTFEFWYIFFIFSQVLFWEVSTRRRTLWLILQYLKRSRTFVALVESVLHSHVRGFNIGPLWRVGWTERAAGVLCSMIKNGKNEGLGIWLAGQPGNWENRRKLGFLPFYSLLSFQRALYDGLRSLADFLLSKCVNRSIANFLFSLTTKTLTPKSAS